MNIQDIKQELGIKGTLCFDFPKNSEGVITSDQWLRAWDDDTRTDVHMHVDTDDKLQANPSLSTLHIQEQTVKSATKGEYTFVRLVARGRSSY